jgi:hypothetical protein
MFKLTLEASSATSTLVARHQWPVKITATNVDNTAAKIFVYQEATGGYGLDFFSCVASALQMYALPEDAAGSDGPFYRGAVLEVLCNTADAATEFYKKVEDAVQDLVDNIAGAQTLTIQREIIIFPRLPNQYTNSVGEVYVNSLNDPYVTA